jgi:hypothetical protein
MEIIRQYAPDSAEVAKLTRACEELTKRSRKGITYKVEDTWFDYGQNWMWTTIIAYDPDSFTGSYQALCPRDYEKILYSNDIPATVNEIRSDKWWRD